MILAICAQQIDEYSFKVWNTVSVQTYEESGIDLSGVTSATLFWKKVNDEAENEVSVDISDVFQYLFTDGGITVSFEDFGLDTIYGETYFPDWMYSVTIEYTYNEVEYDASITVGFLKIIKNIVYQQMMKSNWKKELSCTCGCDSYNTTLRKWDYLMSLDIAAQLCLVNEYEKTLLALYKLTGTEHEFAGS